MTSVLGLLFWASRWLRHGSPLLDYIGMGLLPLAGICSPWR
jgi:hypothetical protein